MDSVFNGGQVQQMIVCMLWPGTRMVCSKYYFWCASMREMTASA
jgi:hypothetical protein